MSHEKKNMSISRWPSFLPSLPRTQAYLGATPQPREFAVCVSFCGRLEGTATRHLGGHLVHRRDGAVLLHSAVDIRVCVYMCTCVSCVCVGGERGGGGAHTGGVNAIQRNVMHCKPGKKTKSVCISVRGRRRGVIRDRSRLVHRSFKKPV